MVGGVLSDAGRIDSGVAMLTAMVWLLIFLILIAGLNVLDAFFTIVILESGGWEVNPLVRWALDTCGDREWIIKFILVSCGAIVLCLHGHFRMARVSIIVAAALYGGVVMYQLVLLR
jgi:hypothetical protein